VKISIRLQKTSQPIKIDNVVNAYTKGPFYCVYTEDGIVRKFPIITIFDVTEDYKEADQ
jgi:hypothetical protein